MSPLERDQAAILTLYTGVICGPVEDALGLAQALLPDRSLELHEIASGDTAKLIHELVTPAFEAMAAHIAMIEPEWPTPPEDGDADNSP